MCLGFIGLKAEATVTLGHIGFVFILLLLGLISFSPFDPVQHICMAATTFLPVITDIVICSLAIGSVF